MRTGLSLFQELTEQQAPANSVRKGRSEELVVQRNERLIHRYLYYLIYTELRPEVVNRHLEAEFDLTETRMLTIIYDHAPQLRALRMNPPSIVQLRAKYPHLVWVATR